MDKPFDPNSLQPTHPWEWEPWRKPYTTTEIRALIKQLNTNTKTIQRYPYDPRNWIRRANTLVKLRYPELAVGDAHKASLLAQKLHEDLDNKPNSRMGYKMGFWMQDSDIEYALIDDEHERQQETIAKMQSKADKIISENLCFAPCVYRGKFVAAPYPWLEEKHKMRSDELIHDINTELADPANGASGGVTCLLKRYAFGYGVGAREGADLLGVFAARDIEEGRVILVDESRTWGCNGPGKDGEVGNLFGGTGCPDPLHPNIDTDDSAHDMRWIRDRVGRDAANVILRCRFLLTCVQDSVQHPLDHSLIARMTPTYRSKDMQFDYEQEVVVPTRALQQFGIDIFANLSFDTWIIFVLGARIDNNAWTDPNAACLNPLFALFNHSCEPNVAWASQDDHRTLQMTTLRHVEEGEQLFVEYDSFMNDKPLEERRKRLRRWLNDPCQCTRCVREESGEASRASSSLNTSFGSSEWDTDEKPALPEDFDDWAEELQAELERRDSLTEC